MAASSSAPVAAALADDLIAFVKDVADFSGNTDLQIRARVLVARIDLEERRLAKRGASGDQHGD